MSSSKIRNIPENSSIYKLGDGGTAGNTDTPCENCTCGKKG